mgnify:CR=1 FL=1
MYFDTHAHYDAAAFDGDRETLLAGLADKGVDLVVDPGADLASSRKAAALARQWPFLYAAAGIHPEAAGEATPDGLDALCALRRENSRVVAIGEIGLDYHYADGAAPDVQKKAFADQLELARELKLPVIVHERDACADCLDIIRRYGDLRGVVHCFSGSWETAREILNLGWFISFTGVITFKNARRAPEVLAKMPRDRLMLETDAPYMAPAPVRGTRNDSSNLRYIAARAAELTGMDVESLCALTKENGRRFFGL